MKDKNSFKLEDRVVSVSGRRGKVIKFDNLSGMVSTTNHSLSSVVPGACLVWYKDELDLVSRRQQKPLTG